MARTTLPVQVPGPTGLVPAYAAADAANGMAFYNNGQTILHVKNGGGSPITVTIATGGTVDGLVLPAQIIAIPATGEKMISLKKTGVYQQADGSTYLDFSSGTSVTVAAFVGGGV